MKKISVLWSNRVPETKRNRIISPDTPLNNFEIKRLFEGEHIVDIEKCKIIFIKY